ncbi:gigasin-6-like [Saccostrea cucullata]|uniref:gigasin-6-like n=1 Tax=Saccostrea cuccullata TaxID=36930 RepID=UPI002ED2B9CE
MALTDHVLLPFTNAVLGNKLYMRLVFECRNLTPGLTISVVKDGKVLMAKGYGVADITTKRPVTNQTLFEIASMSKAFGATLLMKQIGRSGNLSAQSKIKELLGPTFTFADAERNRLADVNDILSQQLGIPGHYLMKLDLNLTRTNLLTRFKYLNGTKPLRQGFLYSGMNYALAMIISEHLGGKTWEELIKKEIFDPLGMSSSTVMSIIPDLSNAARGYVYTENFTLVPVEFALSR